MYLTRLVIYCPLCHSSSYYQGGGVIVRHADAIKERVCD